MEHAQQVTPARPAQLLAPGRPSIWVAAAAAHPVHGAWIDAARPAPLINADIADVVSRNVPDDPATWKIHAFRNFHGLDLGPTPPLPRLSRVARGIAKHGEPFARWVELAPTLRAPLSKFPEHYLGHYACRRAYLEFVVGETAASRGLVPTVTHAQRCGLYAVRLAARQWTNNVVFAEAEEGGVHAFSRC